MIVLLLPSRGRAKNLERLFRSLEETTAGPWWIVAMRDDDDVWDLPRPMTAMTIVAGPRRLLSQYWNDAYDVARRTLPHEDEDGPTIYMHAGDDIEFRTLGWDRIVRDAFPDDGIAFVHGDDLSPNGRTLGTHGFLRAGWVDALGYFVPPYFSSDCNDAWLNEVADYLGRRVYVPVVTEHWHPAFGKAEWDQTHQDRLARHEADNVTELWHALAPERLRDAAKLQAAILAAAGNPLG